METIEPLLLPISQLNLFSFAPEFREEKPCLSLSHPTSTLRLLDRIIADDIHQAPYSLRSVLHAIFETEPALKSDARWQRLMKIADRS